MKTTSEYKECSLSEQTFVSKLYSVLLEKLDENSKKTHHKETEKITTGCRKRTNFALVKNKSQNLQERACRFFKTFQEYICTHALALNSQKPTLCDRKLYPWKHCRAISREYRCQRTNGHVCGVSLIQPICP
ncbi:MAG: hypothetical protein ACP5RT_02360 [Candidatus Micrarchaeia archaeon]